VIAVPVRIDRSSFVGSHTRAGIAPDLFVLEDGEAVDSCSVQAIEGGRG